MNYAQIRRYDAANGNGIGCTLFVSGCTFHCKNCFNKEYQNFNYGKPFDLDTKNKFIEMCKNPNVDHVSLLGGEVLHQNLAIIVDLLSRLKEEVKKPIWLWTGYTYKEMDSFRKLIVEKYVDYLIDGKYIEELKDLNLLYRGSSNQNVYKKVNGVFTKIL